MPGEGYSGEWFLWGAPSAVAIGDVINQGDAELIVRAVNAYEPLVKALQGIVDEPYGCAFCDYGVLRNPTKEHADDCSWVAARAALAIVTESDSGTSVESSPEREGGE